MSTKGCKQERDQTSTELVGCHRKVELHVSARWLGVKQSLHEGGGGLMFILVVMFVLCSGYVPCSMPGCLYIPVALAYKLAKTTKVFVVAQDVDRSWTGAPRQVPCMKSWMIPGLSGSFKCVEARNTDQPSLSPVFRIWSARLS